MGNRCTGKGEKIILNYFLKKPFPHVKSDGLGFLHHFCPGLSKRVKCTPWRSSELDTIANNIDTEKICTSVQPP